MKDYNVDASKAQGMPDEIAKLQRDLDKEGDDGSKIEGHMPKIIYSVSQFVDQREEEMQGLENRIRELKEPIHGQSMTERDKKIIGNVIKKNQAKQELIKQQMRTVAKFFNEATQDYDRKLRNQVTPQKGLKFFLKKAYNFFKGMIRPKSKGTIEHKPDDLAQLHAVKSKISRFTNSNLGMSADEKPEKLDDSE